MGDTGTSDTMPCHHWVAAVLDEAKISKDELDRYVTRRRLHVWFHAGETISGAVDMIRHFVDGGKRADRTDGEVDFLRRAVKAATRGSR